MSCIVWIYVNVFSKRHPVSPLEMDFPVGTSLMFVLLFNNHDCFLVSFLLQRNNQSGKRFRVDLLASCLPTHNLTWHIHFVYVHTETLSSPIFDSPISKWNTPLPIFPSQHLATHKHCPSEEGGTFTGWHVLHQQQTQHTHSPQRAIFRGAAIPKSHSNRKEMALLAYLASEDLHGVDRLLLL